MACLHRAGRPGPRGPSRGESFEEPAPVRPAAIEEAVVEPARAALPELDRLGDDEIAAPVRRARDLAAGVAGLDLTTPFLQGWPVGEDLALGGGPGPDLRPGRAGAEIGVRLGLGGPLRPPLD